MIFTDEELENYMRLELQEDKYRLEAEKFNKLKKDYLSKLIAKNRVNDYIRSKELID